MEHVDRLVRWMSGAAHDPELSVLALDEANALAKIPPDELAPHVPRLVLALSNWFSVTGGDAAIDRVARVLEGIDSKPLVAAFENATAALTEGERASYLRDLDVLAFPCPAFLPVLKALRPPVEEPEVDAAFESDVALFRPYAQELIAVLAERAELGSVGAYITAVRARLQSKGSLQSHYVVALEWAMLGLVTSDDLTAIESRLKGASPLPPNFEIQRFFNVFAWKRVVEVVRDPVSEIDPAALSERGVYEDEIEIGAEFGVEEESRTRALQVATLRALGL